VPADVAPVSNDQAPPPEQTGGDEAAPSTEPVEPQAQQTEQPAGGARPAPSGDVVNRGVQRLPQAEEPTAVPADSPTDDSADVEWHPKLAPRLPKPVEAVPTSDGSDVSKIPSKPIAPTVVAALLNATEDAADEAATASQGRQNHPVKTEQAVVELAEDVPADLTKSASETPVRSINSERRLSQEALGDLAKGPTIQDRKMAIAASDLDRDAQTADSASQKTTGDRQVRPGVQHGSVERATQSTPVTFGGVSGDSAAASMAAFLLSPATVDGGAISQALAVSSTAAVTSGTGGSGGASSSDQSSAVQAAAVPGVLSSFGVDGPLAFDDAARVLAASSGGTRHEVTLRLEPPELGQLKVQIRMQHQAMTMQVDADSPTVARLIESRLTDLRDALALHGIKMDRADVVIRSPAPSDTNTQQQNSQQNGWADQGGSAGDEFTGWRDHDGRTADFQEQQSSWQSGGGEFADSAGNAGAVLAEEVLAGMELNPTTELSLDLVA
jgi:flagellar hook-length control protein FliK